MTKKQMTGSRQFKTVDLNTKGVSAGKLTEEGMVIIPQTIEDAEGRNGVFHILHGKDEQGKDVDLLFSSNKLYTIISENWKDIVDQHVNIAGAGDGFNREYTVTLL